MRKLMLDINDLQVESFRTTADSEPQRGTVRAHGEFTPVSSDVDDGYSTGACLCACDTTHTLRFPECGDPSDLNMCP